MAGVAIASDTKIFLTRIFEGFAQKINPAAIAEYFIGISIPKLFRPPPAN